MFRNNTLSEQFVVEPNEKVIDYLSFCDANKELAEKVEGKAWQQVVGNLAFGGLPDEYEKGMEKLKSLEVDVRTKFALPSARPGGKRSAGTGFKLHPTFKSYKSTLKGAFENGVELLDADGMPRSRGVIAQEVKDASRVDKSFEEKLTQATATWIAIYSKCSLGDPAVTDAVNTIVNRLHSDGMI